jgi:ABC-2 type transport system permease protein
MLRYLRLYRSLVRFSFSRAMEFRVDFFFRVLMDLVFYATQVGFFAVIYGHTQELGGWDFAQTLIFISGYFLVDAIHMTLFANNMWMFPLLVNKGDLDYYLVRPVSSLFFVSMREFAANSFLNLLVAVGISAYALSSYPEPLSAGRIALYIILILNGAFLYYIVQMMFLIPVFWLHSARGLGEIFFSLGKYAERPEKIFQGYVRRALVTIIPLSLIASRPAQQLFDGADAGTLMHIAAVTAAFMGGLVLFWHRALRAYSSASS